MSQNRDNIEPLIQEIRTLSVAEKAKTGALALLNIIPYAGGAIASVVSEYATHRKAEKVCEVLSDLNAKLESHEADPESHLSKDQIIEVVHETLQTAATASDERKIAALKNGLGYAFLADDSFERKQLLLQTLRNCTSMELAVLAVLYDSGDPYIVYEGGPPSHPSQIGYSAGFVATPYSSSLTPQGDWKPIGNRDNCGQPALLKFLADRVHFNESDVDGALRLLDGKGLARAGANLNRSDCKVLEWTPSSTNGIYMGTITASSAALYNIREVRATPLEASRTDFGRGFLSFCRNSQ